MISKLGKIYVLQIGMTRNIGGIESYLIQQFRYLDKSKIVFDFVNITSEYEIVFKNEIMRENSNVYEICSRHLNPLLHYWKWACLLWKNRNKYKAIVLNAVDLSYIFPLFIAKLVGIPIRVIHAHNAGCGYRVGFLKKMLINFNKILLNFSATTYFACSKKAGLWMFGKNKNFNVIHNAIEINKYKYNFFIRKKKRQEFDLEKNFVIGHVGRFVYQKNHEFLIDIFNEIYKILPESKLLLVGDAVDDKIYLDKVKEKVKCLGLEKSIKFLGMRNDVPELMQAMDCFILTSRFEGLPLVGIEAQAAGLPCYFSDTITDEVRISDLVSFISLNKSPKIWAEKIVKNREIKRKSALEELKKAGYDINTEIKKIEDFF